MQQSHLLTAAERDNEVTAPRLYDPPLSRRAFLLQHFEDWVVCPRMLTFKIKQIPFCYIWTNFERSMNA